MRPICGVGIIGGGPIHPSQGATAVIFVMASVALAGPCMADVGGTVTLLAPNGDEILEGGSAQTLEFETSTPGGEVRFALSLDGGGTYPVALGAMPNAGGRQTFNWTVPTNLSSIEVRAQVVWLAGNAPNLTVVASDASDGDLAIRQHGQGEETGGWSTLTWALLVLIATLMITGVAAYTVMWRRGERPKPSMLMDDRLQPYRDEIGREAGRGAPGTDDMTGPPRKDPDRPKNAI